MSAGLLDPDVGIRDRVRIRESVRQIAGNPAVVRNLGESAPVVRVKRADYAAIGAQLQVIGVRAHLVGQSAPR